MSPLYRFDLQWFRAINGRHSPILDPFFAFFSYLGLGEVLALIAIGLLLIHKARPYVFPLLCTLLLSSITCQIPKQLLNRDRPSRLYFAHAEEALYAHSFPSGHTTASFAFAFMVVFMTFGTKRAWIGWLCLLLALLVGFSRIYRGVHWPSDVIGGIFFGCGTAAITYLVLDRLGKVAHLDTPGATLTGREASEAADLEAPDSNR